MNILKTEELRDYDYRGIFICVSDEYVYFAC